MSVTLDSIQQLENHARGDMPDKCLANDPVLSLPRKAVDSEPDAVVADGDVTLVDRARGAVLLESDPVTPQDVDQADRENPSPQDNDMGVTNTESSHLALRKRAKVSLDWLTVTLPVQVVDLAHKSPYTLVDLIGLPVDHILDEGHGESGYTALYTLDVPGARLRVGGNAGTASLQLSGGALKHFEDKGLDVFGLLRYLHDLDAKATRLDWAFDDYVGALDFETLTQGIRDGGGSDLVTIYRSTPTLQGSKPFGGDDWTVYFGAKSSASRVRIYNKRAEQLNKGQEVTRPHWIRTEVQLRKDKAAKAFESWVSSDFAARYALGILRGSVDFRTPTEDTNRSRWPIAAWWGAFVGVVEVLKVTLEGRTRDYEAMKRWLQKQVAKSLALLEDIEGADAVGALIGDGRARYSDHDEAFRDAALVDKAHGPPDTDRPPGQTSPGMDYSLRNLSEQLERRETLRDVAWAMGA